MKIKTLLLTILTALLLQGCVHARLGEAEYWRFGPQELNGEVLLIAPDGTELLIDGTQKSELPTVTVTATSITVGGKAVGK